jgi:hypothetical protein
VASLVKVKAAKCGNCIIDNANIRTWGDIVASGGLASGGAASSYIFLLSSLPSDSLGNHNHSLETTQVGESLNQAENLASNPLDI